MVNGQLQPTVDSCDQSTMALSQPFFLCAVVLAFVTTYRPINAFTRQLTFPFSTKKPLADARTNMLFIPTPRRPALLPLSTMSTDSGADKEPVKEQQGNLSRIQNTVLNGEWKDNLLKISTYASLLCVLDCTILPLVTIVLPLFGIVAGSPAQMQWLHEFGHSVALFFVLPVGGLATTMNYLYSHRKTWIAACGYTGLTLVLASNVGCAWAHYIPGATGHLMHDWLHVLHHGVVHRVANLAGCFFLLGSNYLSHRLGGCAHGPSCESDHSQAHHGHNH
jgi:hypothetical protein